MKGFTLGLTLKQRRKATRKSPIASSSYIVIQVWNLQSKQMNAIKKMYEKELIKVSNSDKTWKEENDSKA